MWAGETVLYPCYGSEEFSVIPAALGLDRETMGRPAFQLQLVRRSDDLRAEGQYALIDVRLAGSYDLDSCLATARAARPDAIVRPATIDRGFARLVPVGAGVGLPSDLTAPTELGWSTADGVRWTQKLDVSSGELIKGALKDRTILFGARAEFTVLGIAPRMPARAILEPAPILDAALRGTTNRHTGVADLLAFLSRPVDALTLQIAPSGDKSRLPQILLDRLFAAYGVLVPAQDADSGPTIAFSTPPSGEVVWDLSQPCVVSRAFTLQFDLLTALKDVGDTSALVHETIIPPLDLGFHDIVVAANLPIHRSGVPAVGVRIDIAPNPPHRPSGITETLVFEAPDDQQNVSVSLSPGEALKYDMVCFAVLATGQTVQQVEAPPKQASAQWLQLQPNDFPLLFVHITATDRLLALAAIDGTLSYFHSGNSISQPIRLDHDATDIALAYPANATNVAVAVDATARDASKSLPIPGLSAGRILLDLTSFPDYGPHRIPVTCDFKSGQGMLSIELVGEDGANPATVTLLPAMPTSTWGYVAQSPFRAGYRYRLPDGDWTDVAASSAPLSLTVN